MTEDTAPPSHAELAALRARLDEAEATIRAISSGEVDAFMVRHGAEDQVLVLEGVDRPYRLLIERMHQAAVIVTGDGTITYANRRLGELLRRPLQSLIGTSLEAWADLSDQPKLRRLLAAADGDEDEQEIVFCRADLTTICTHVAATSLVEQTGLLCVLVTDLTERDHFAREHSARVAAEATSGALREADQRKNEFLAMLAHELRGPLAPIRNGIEVLRLSGPAEPTTQHLHGMMARQVENLVRLVDDLLDVSRVTQGKIRLQPERVDLRTVITRAVESARPGIEARDHRFRMTLGEQPLMVDADAVRMAQVVINLLNNAAKFTPPGGDISLDAHADNADHAVIRITDTGIGLSGDMLPRVFELFVQVDPTVSRSEGGLGIGLTLARQLVEMHHGTIEGHSEGESRGTAFTIRIPLAAAAGALSRPARSTAGTRTPRRVLVVDDNRDAAESLAMLLRLQGHDVRREFDGESVQAAVHAFNPEVLLLDIGLPGMNGYQVAEQLRAAGGRLPRLVALSGYGSEDDRRRSREAGFDEHLAKPVELPVLDALLAALPSE